MHVLLVHCVPLAVIAEHLTHSLTDVVILFLYVLTVIYIYTIFLFLFYYILAFATHS